MAITLNLVTGGTTLQLNGGTTYRLLEEYQPRPRFTRKQLRDIMAGVADPELTVTESVKLRVTAASVAALETAIEAIDNALAVGATLRDESGAGDQTFLKFTPSGGTAHRSEILGGGTETLPKTLAVWQWDAKDVDIIAAWTRRYYFERDTRTQIPLTNGNATDTTSALPLFNYSDGTGSAPNVKHNYAEMAAANVLGLLPCPPELEITNTFATNGARRIYIAHKAQGTPASFVHVLEAEDATLGTGVTNAVDANASGGDVSSVANVPATQRTLFTWTISATQAGYIISQWVKILARFSTLPNNTTCRARFLLQDSTTGAQIAETPWVSLSSADYLQQLGTLRMSPNLQGQTTPGAMKLLMVAKDSAATCDFGLDFIQLSPSNQGRGFRKLAPIDESLVSVPASTGVITDDMIERSVRIESRQNVYLGFGGPIMLIPARINRLYFLHDGADASAAIARTLTLKAYHRPRVLNV